MRKAHYLAAILLGGCVFALSSEAKAQDFVPRNMMCNIGPICGGAYAGGGYGGYNSGMYITAAPVMAPNPALGNQYLGYRYRGHRLSHHSRGYTY